MEMGNVSKRQQPDIKAENSRRLPMGFQYSEKKSRPEACFSKPLNKMDTSSVVMDVILISEIYNI